ncbi:MAG: hypothetical protein M0C28_27525 [Candidatus Moduliflexus flocculans]|nr:hypothetical protein [Candidatus Moduliflexus flocculans]
MKRCLQLMDVDRRMGFRSSFNFVPEDYPTPSRIVRTLSEAGFEVGVHGLKHDGKLFRRPAEFHAKAPRIESLPPTAGARWASARRPCSAS